MKGINLLPTQVLAQSSVAKFATVVRNITTAGFIVLIVAAGALFSYFLILSFQINGSLARGTQLKNSIRAKESTEQAYVLVVDRVNKGKLIFAKKSAEGTADKIDNLISSFDANTTLETAEIRAGSSTLEVSNNTSSSMLTFLGSLATGEIFSSIDLSSFVFKPAGGYAIGLNFSDE